MKRSFWIAPGPGCFDALLIARLYDSGVTVMTFRAGLMSDAEVA
ncbi:hypothetical protein [Natronohydrobacter thiooxidans]|nr:hypothetical protein [Natronohydrobacter thiooxidans]